MKKPVVVLIVIFAVGLLLMLMGYLVMRSTPPEAPTPTADSPGAEMEIPADLEAQLGTLGYLDGDKATGEAE